MSLSVIIPTRNRAGVLDACLSSIAEQSLATSEFEVIVVDNGSTDETPHVVERHHASLQLRCVHAPEPGLHVGRHEGLREARGDVLAFADDDIVAEPAWLATVVERFRDPSVALVGGNNLPLFEHAPPEWLARWWDIPANHGRALGHLSILDFGQGRFDIDPNFVWGCNFSIRRQTLLDAGGFHPDAMPTERLRWRGDGETHVSEWIRRSGLRTIFDSGASVHHRVPASRMSPGYFEQRSFAQGISDSYTDIRRAGGSRIPVFASAQLRVKTGLRRLRLHATRTTDEADAKLKGVQLGALAAWERGYDFHQKEVRKDPALFSWVMKETYL
ncbi:glycosyltransferase family 2 protein [Thermomonas sp. HDW16]|uniref:glycosyltransferase n=1 Tax=Thermomonas sp. HDW16 TaxID=2714945 RepID=UPI00140D0935|nr:glycosyltransferase family 2 protein [Thermomonas sp. HDW16]QIL21423.1 glycosyltransferase family 2 protein [Thermomonas sp. HDW16]